MTIAEIILLALALSADAFSVAAVVGLSSCTPRQVFRLSFHFGLFQSLMPVLGAAAGLLLFDAVQTYAPWIAFGLLELIGIKMLWEALRPKKEDDTCRTHDPTRGFSLVGLSLAVSIDAMGAGVGLAMVLTWVPLIASVIFIGVTTGLITWLGMKTGRFIQSRVGRKVELLGGIVLILLGVRMLWM
jgi:manganese efflux pump family protein